MVGHVGLPFADVRCPGTQMLVIVAGSSLHLCLQSAALYSLALTRRGRAGRVWLPRTSEIIRSIAEASEVTRQWRTLKTVVSG